MTSDKKQVPLSYLIILAIFTVIFAFIALCKGYSEGYDKGVSFGLTNEREYWEKTTALRGVAEYHPQTGRWQWKESQ